MLRDRITIRPGFLFKDFLAERWTPIDNIVGRNYPPRTKTEGSMKYLDRVGNQWYLRVSHHYFSPKGE